MRYRSLPLAALALSSLALAGCGNEPTQPSGAAEARPTVPELAVASNTWITKADMWSVERRDFAVATVTNAAGQSVLYAIGGRSAGGSLSKVMAYNVATNTWILRASLPKPLFATNGAGVLNGKIYVSGGITDPDWYHYPPNGYLFVYDPATNTWAQKRGMPEAGSNGVTGVMNGKLYVVTTCWEAPPMEYYFAPCDNAKFFRYNRVTDQWTVLPAPGGTYDVGGVINGKFYVAGGRTLKAYDPATNQWTTKAAPPTSVGYFYGAAGTAMLGRLWIAGGRVLIGGEWVNSRALMAYDAATNTWATKAPMPTARTGSAASRVFVNGVPRLEVVGGSRPGNNVQYVP